MSSGFNNILITRDGAPLNDYDEAYLALLKFTRHMSGQMVTVLYRVNVYSDPVASLVAMGTKDWVDCGPQGQWDADPYLNKYYPEDQYPDGPCGPEFFEIISGKEGSGSETRATAYKIQGEDYVYVDAADIMDTSEYCTITQKILELDREFKPADGVLCVVEIEAKDNRPITYITYVYDEDISTWKQVDISSEHVYFYDGVRRTEAWGSQESTGKKGIVNECVGMNLQQLMDYFLIKSHEVEPIGSWGNISPKQVGFIGDPQLTGLSKITNGALVEVRTVLQTGSCSADPTFNITNINQTFGPASVARLTYGYLDNSGVVHSETNIVGDEVSMSIGNEFINPNANIKVTHNGDEVSSITSEYNDGWEPLTIQSQPITVVEGINTIKLDYKNNIQLQTEDTTVYIPAIPDYQCLDNTGENIKLISEVITGANVVGDPKEIKYIGTNVGVTNNSKNITKVVYGVYPFYTNGVGNTDMTGKRYDHTQARWANWESDANIGDDSGCGKISQLYNYVINNEITIFAGFGSTVATSNIRRIYVPATFDADGWTLDSAIEFRDDIGVYSGTPAIFERVPGIKTINFDDQVAEVVEWKIIKNAGPNHWKLTFKKN